MHNLKISSKYVCPVNGAIGIHPACSDPWTNLLYGSSAHRCNLHFIVTTRTAQMVQIFQNNLLKLVPYYQSNNPSSVYLPYIYEWLCFPGLSHKFILWKCFISVCKPKNGHLLGQWGNSSSPTWLIHLTLIKQHPTFFLYSELNIKKEQLHCWSTILKKKYKGKFC